MKPEFPQPYYCLRGWSVPWRRYPIWLWVGYRIVDGKAVSLDGTKTASLPTEKEANTDATIVSFLAGLCLTVLIYSVIVG